MERVALDHPVGDTVPVRLRVAEEEGERDAEAHSVADLEPLGEPEGEPVALREGVCVAQPLGVAVAQGEGEKVVAALGERRDRVAEAEAQVVALTVMVGVMLPEGEAGGEALRLRVTETVKEGLGEVVAEVDTEPERVRVRELRGDFEKSEEAERVRVTEGVLEVERE